MEELLFVYGTLKEPSVQKEIIGRIVKGNLDILEGYKKSKIEINGKNYPIVIPNPNNFVKGLVISITSKELKLIDKYETKAYRRKKIVLKSGKNAWMYQK